ncbi:hypothetical protein [Streptomyces cyaneofuscatus]|uniref:hypothetical protein n=1 Tax=Streptomyces cyaneofuscatus TaxID=66883 RepID=UPI0037F2EB5A
MTRLQILELPMGPDDKRPPFVLVVDEYRPPRPATMQEALFVDPVADMAHRAGARGTLVFAETVEIPANELLPTESFELVGDRWLDAERMRSITDAAGFDRMDNWPDILAALRAARAPEEGYPQPSDEDGGP